MDKPVKNGQKLVIVGAGEFAEIAYEYFTYDSPYEIAAFTVEKDYIKTDQLYELPVVPFDEVHRVYPINEYKAFVAVPFTNLNRLRTRFYHETKNKGYELVSYISSKAFVWRNVTIGENCFIFENNVLQHHVNVGNNVILWSGNHVGHRSVIKDNCFISSHVVIAGNCEIGENCFIGVNSTFNDEIKVGKDCFISSGALVIKNAPEGKIYKGSPAKASSVDVYRYFNIESELVL
ncbi:sugar O-acyltransferase, sialic acid O-acetyltransferase NeuD family [Psychrobacillus psychrotolerans]|uniref:Sugar O-acyltransferase, sialic acid O-acetyltransferase NeuD family n=1 Tax=Psychrobacillus psychrotolerans TaxID=126156 RepID=A0A1I6A1B7_9BACI|nr:acetyltransferase [Psychrobacillus psychrotolerans]SFQ62509.1 sugar O-acyltransferase, sialic acid O-acetyltransferase NeuD family [Psychrobacillus psychrotolerans]